ncbi:MAG: hypothetical protein APF77_13590 [Clostridia bacterium BRH_c25]|nr:MAG: hypothetical protein APF77_13590 [Clostridia bacterium BRH_c25]
MDFILNESRKVYISKINMVQDYIENHLADELHIENLAGIASFSEFHFQRIYRQIAGESLYSYIKRLRLEKAVFLIRSNKRLSLLDIALSVGFSNQASFAKALKDKYKVSASTIKKLDNLEMDKLINEISINGKVCEKKTYYNIPMELTIRIIDSTRVLYIRHTGAYKGNSDLFVKLFTKLYNFAFKKNLVKPETKWFTVYHDFGNLTMEEKLRLSVCMSITDEVEDSGEFGSMDLAGGKYAVGRFLLKSDEYQGAWDYMLSKWLPESGYMPDDRLCFEYYPPQEYTAEKEERIVEIFIPITPL